MIPCPQYLVVKDNIMSSNHKHALIYETIDSWGEHPCPLQVPYQYSCRPMDPNKVAVIVLVRLET